LIPPILGLFLLLATAGVVGLALVTHLYGRWAGNAALARGSLLGAAAVAAAYGLIWIVTVATTRTRGLVLGDEVHFCGLDYHLHVSVLEVKRESDLGVRVRFRSDARQADEFPGELRLRVVDSAGREYPPSSGMIAEPLHAGDAIEREFRFSLPPDAALPRLVVTYHGWLDYLLPGVANPLVQGRRQLELGARRAG